MADPANPPPDTPPSPQMPDVKWLERHDLTEAQWRNRLSEGWTTATYARLHKVQRQRDAARERAETLASQQIDTPSPSNLTPPPAPQEPTVPTPPTPAPPTAPQADPALSQIQQQLAQMQAALDAERAQRITAERRMALTTAGVSEAAVQDFLLQQYSTLGDKAPDFAEWQTGLKDHPVLSRIITPAAAPPTADPPPADAPPAPGLPPRPPAQRSAPNNGFQQPPPPGPTLYSEEGVARMSAADRARLAPQIAQQAVAEGKIVVHSEALRKKLGLSG